jgi:hypothetical protein
VKHVALAWALAASAAAAVGWARTATQLEGRAPSIRIVDVRPLQSPTSVLRDLMTHTFAVRVALNGWTPLPYQPGATASDNRPAAGHWRLYLDGFSLGDNFGDEQITYTPYLSPGTHWIAAELSNADSTSLDSAVWSEPVILHVPRVLRCWQTGWRGSPRDRNPTFNCNHRQTQPRGVAVRPKQRERRRLRGAREHAFHAEQTDWWVPRGFETLNRLLAEGRSYPSMGWP